MENSLDMIKNVVTQTIEKLAKLESNQEASLNKLEEIKAKDFAKYLLILSRISVDNKIQISTRSYSLILLKNALFSQNKKLMNSNKERWSQITQQIRNEIFTNTFQLLGITEFSRFAPITLTYLCLMDSEANTWMQLVSTLESNITNQTNDAAMVLKQSSITTLGYIAQEMGDYLDSSVSLQILRAVSIGVQSTDSILKLSSATALCNVLESVEDQVSNKEFRDQLLKLVLSLKEDEKEEKMKVQSYACIAKIGEIYYDYLSEYIEFLFQITVEGMANNSNKFIAMYSISFWSAIAQKEHELLQLEKVSDPKNSDLQSKNYYSKAALSYITPILLKHLEGNEGMELDGWCKCNHAANCLTKLSLCWGDMILEYVGTFFSQQIVKQEWYARNSAVLAFGSVLEGPTLSALTSALPQIWPLLINATEDQNLEFRDTVFWVIGKLAPVHPQFIACKKDEILPILLKNLEIDEKVIESVTNTISVIFEVLGNLWDKNSLKNPTKQDFFYPEQTIIHLIGIFIRNIRNYNDVKITITSLGSISNLINSLKNLNFTNLGLFAFKECTSLLKDSIEKEQNNIISAILYTIQAIIESNGSQHQQISIDMLNHLKHMQENNIIVKLSILCDVLSLISTIVNFIEGSLIPYIPFFFNVIYSGLMEYEYDFEACHSSLTLISILTQIMMNDFFSSFSFQNLNGIFEILHKILNDNSVNGIRLRNSVIDCYGDIMLVPNQTILDNFLLNIFESVIKAINTEFDHTEDIYQYKYAVEYYVSCMNTLSAALQAIYAQQPPRQKQKLIQTLIEFLNKIITSLARIATNFSMNEEIQLPLTGLIGDLCRYHPMEMLKSFKEIENKSNLSSTNQSSIIIKSNNLSNGLKSILQQAKSTDNQQLQEVYSYTAEQLRLAKIEVS